MLEIRVKYFCVNLSSPETMGIFSSKRCNAIEYRLLTYSRNILIYKLTSILIIYDQEK